MLPTLPRRPSVATPSKKGEFCTALRSKFPFHGIGNLDRREIMLNFISLFAVEKNKSNEEMIIIDFNKESYQQNIQNMDNYIKKLDKKL